jgi:hypothetical protein
MISERQLGGLRQDEYEAANSGLSDVEGPIKAVIASATKELGGRICVEVVVGKRLGV